MRRMVLQPKKETAARRRSLLRPTALLTVALLCLFAAPRWLFAANDRDEPGPGFVNEFAASLDDVLQALQDSLQDQIIHGTYVFEKEKTLTGASVVESTPLFQPWTEGGKVFYKVRTGAIAPRHFRDSADQG